jgi:cytochrome c553
MNKYNLISILALVVLVIVLPFYMMKENIRLEQAKNSLQDQFILDGSVLYIENCAGCHGIEGEGLGMNPPLNKMRMAEADPGLLARTIARAAHGSSMAAWHIAEGGILDDYQIEELVTLIRFADWSEVSLLAGERGVYPEQISTMEIEESFLAGLGVADPHQCISCHEEPEVHAERFGLDCVRCHSLVTWTPASLTRHTFRLDHGNEGTVACETCHIASYTENSCYECHDHKPDEMVELHEKENIINMENCIECHPTGEPDEAKDFLNNTLASK